MGVCGVENIAVVDNGLERQVNTEFKEKRYKGENLKRSWMHRVNLTSNPHNFENEKGTLLIIG